jgi:hypothetical protein
MAPVRHATRENPMPPTGLPRSGFGLSLICLLACCMALLWIQAVNGNPLFYYDLHNYLLRGSKGLAMFLPDSWFEVPQSASSRPGAAVAVEDNTVNGSRSIIYSMLLAGFYQLKLQAAFPAFQAACVLAVTWVLGRVALRCAGDARAAMPFITGPILVASLGALPFYVAYLMPDILAPLIILSAAAITLYGPRLRPWEALILIAISAIGVLSHPSHPMIAFAMVLPAAVFGWLAHRGGRQDGARKGGAWMGAAFLIGLGVLGVSERLAFQTAVQQVQKQQVIYWPFLTARLIADGPGLTYLADNCPDPAIATCLLYDKLQASDDPMRLTASHIVFATDERLGSFLLLPPEEQLRVAEAQVDFARSVALDRPVEVVGAVLGNTLRQLRLNSVDMTVPEQTLVASWSELYPWLAPSRLSLQGRDWLVWAAPAQGVLNGGAALVLLAVLVWPGRFSRQARLLAAFVLMGVLANAFVCGAVSQPATRYGARVIWLLPLMAVFLVMLRRPAAGGMPPAPR